MLAGLLLHWHALNCAIALVSNHDIWTLSRSTQMLCCWILQNHSRCLYDFPSSVLFVCTNSRLLSSLWQEAYHDSAGRTQNTFWTHPVIPAEVWYFVGVLATCLQCFEVWSISSLGFIIKCLSVCISDPCKCKKVPYIVFPTEYMLLTGAIGKIYYGSVCQFSVD